MAYYKPGTLTAGFDCFIKEQRFGEGFDSLNAVVEHNGDKNSVILAVMNENYDYSVTLNAQPACFNTRANGTLEIKLPEAKGEYTVKITRR